MLEKLFVQIATALLEKLGHWLAKKIDDARINRREHARIQQTTDRLKQAQDASDFDSAVDDLA